MDAAVCMFFSVSKAEFEQETKHERARKNSGAI
jgi:hypothetical protein